MTRYTEKDIENALRDIKSGVSVRHTVKLHGVPKDTLHDRLNGTQPHRLAHFDQLRLSVDQEEHLKQWVLCQKALGYVPSHEQLQIITNGILKR